MSSTKALLKQAREALASKQWKEALIHLKGIAEDERTYDTYV
jgi:hypothetical protein